MKPKGCLAKTHLILILVAFAAFASAQRGNQDRIISTFPGSASPIPFLPQEKNSDLFGRATRFVENIGQYGDTLARFASMGKIRYGFEGLDMPILLTDRGIVYLQRKLHDTNKKELEEMERRGTLDRKKREGRLHTDRMITMEWINGNPNPQIITEDPSSYYFSYAGIPSTALGFRKITYKNMYPGIDVVYSFSDRDQRGFEYSLVVQPGADPQLAKFRLGGDIKELEKDATGNLVFSSDIGGFVQTAPLSYQYNVDDHPGIMFKESDEKIASAFFTLDHEIGFSFPKGYDARRKLVIDPFVTPATNLTGVHSGIAKDVDFDYAGNIYVAGGGDLGVHQLAKFDKDGRLLWTFNGTLTSPAWSFGSNYGGWVVEKTSGKIYLGQGGNASFRIVRLSTNGLYDGFITDSDPVFQENWKMIWNCDGGTPKILIAGGGSVNQNINLGICLPPSTSLTPLNITGQPTGHQDVADLVIDPKSNDLYTLFAQGFIVPITENNRLYKHTPPYTSANRSWNRLSGFTVLNERANRPYLSSGMGFNDNSINGLAINSKYLFYYDGRNLMALQKSTGNTAGTTLTLSNNTVLMQGGIVADECDNVYIGSVNGKIKVYKFNGSSFDDNAAPDLSIGGFSTSSVFDIVYDNAKNKLYACGNGFVASIDIASYCSAAIYKLEIARDCIRLNATATTNPPVPAGSSVTYELYDANGLISTSNNGIFTGLSKNVVYTVRALIDKACGGPTTTKDFILDSCDIAGGPLPSTGSGIYVPTGFTPNGDGLNDVLKAIPYGIKQFRHFSLYNRWGELIFRTSDPSQGWDGTITGRPQGSAVYVWKAEAIDLEDKLISVKGITTLIR